VIGLALLAQQGQDISQSTFATPLVTDHCDKFEVQRKLDIS
jgi:hypothetical protein